MKKHFTMIMEEGRREGRSTNTKTLVLGDGTTMSVQASNFHYCSPRIDTHYWNYEEFEIGFPSVEIDELMPYVEDESCPTDTVYAYVPVSVIEAVIESRGGVVGTGE